MKLILKHSRQVLKKFPFPDRFVLFLSALLFLIFTVPWADLLLLLPHLSLLDKTQFRLCFYSGLYSGTIYSTFTGVVVGYIIFYLNRSEDRRIAREASIEEFNTFIQELRAVLAVEHTLQYADPIFYSPRLKQAYELISMAPLLQWNKHISHKVLSCLNQFMSIFLVLQKEANVFKAELNARLGSEITVSEWDEHCFTLVHGAFCGQDIEQLTTTLKLENGSIAAEQTKVICGDSVLREHFTAYAKQRSKMDIILKRLQALVSG